MSGEMQMNNTDEDGQLGHRVFAPVKTGLYDPSYEHDACGVGFVADIDGCPSHEVVLKGIEVLVNLLHRGASGSDAETGDGAGVLIQIPDSFLRRECLSIGINLPRRGEYGVGMVFLPDDDDLRAGCRSIMESSVAEEGMKVLGWRNVPVNPGVLGATARVSMPVIMQSFIDPCGVPPQHLERKLYVIRRVIERSVNEQLKTGDRFYICSLSSRTMVYKGMMMGAQISGFFEDMHDPEMSSAVAVVHQRYSTNTFPSWKLAQPFRYLAHNGEINTLRGNRHQMRSRERSLESPLFGQDIKKLFPVIDESGSDSANLDNVLELLTMVGRDLPHSLMMLIPQAWGAQYPIGPDLRGFFEYHSGLMEPWDGPAAVAFTDGNITGALLDRNGLRPCRYTITKDRFMVLSSETGVIDFAPDRIQEHGALRPGEMILVDFREKRVLKNKEIKTEYARKNPYRRWVDENKIELRGFFGDVAPVSPDADTLLYRQKLFGYSREDINLILVPMAAKGGEPVGSMGFDAPLAVLSEKPQLLYSYFKQMFAQITNPPIDPIREELVMSLMTFIGNTANILMEVPANARLVKLLHPILSNDDLERMKQLAIEGLKPVVLPLGFKVDGGRAGLKRALDKLCEEAERAVYDGFGLIILSDRDLDQGEMPIPALLGVSAVNQYLIEKGLRTSAGLIVETGEARETHHIALLLGYGATAINPYLAFETVADLVSRGIVDHGVSPAVAIENYIAAICSGLRKIMSKMGISALRSYRGAQVFEAIGLNDDLVKCYFSGTSSRIGGIALDEIAEEVKARYDYAAGGVKMLSSGGSYRYRKDGERHLWTPESISKLQMATRLNDEKAYREYADLINNQTRCLSTLRGMFDFKTTHPVPIDEVEPVDEIVKRFVTSAMSFGSISREAHETLAVAMNRLGAMSNGGEGGEDSERYKLLPNGDNRCSAVKQVASGRFGVTAEYLVNAKELQIKIAQGAKPGEGGQLPGHKVNVEIAKVRHSTPGVTLISPPPHHDIYSIEDIKQLIFDLKSINPDACVSVKLVSEVGVGTIAAGVAKAKADKVLISGYDGGTGASPLSSIRHAGAPWELGLAETHQTLMLNRLRDRIRVQVDGQLKTGRDVVMAALLGAEEFGFATAPLVVCGCVMMRKCNENICPVGIATQDPELRKRFSGKPEYVINFFRMMAQEVREYMARLGFRKMEEMIGRTDLLDVNPAVDFWKAKGLDFSKVFNRFGKISGGPAYCSAGRVPDAANVLDVKLIEMARGAIENGTPVEMVMSIRNVNLTVGARLSGLIARRYGGKGLPEDTIRCRFQGSAGQSFGAFGIRGMTLLLQGDANDYLGKGLSGGKIIVTPPEGINFDPSVNTICGNVLLYGATSGEVYINGTAGERFAVRNSGAVAVVEGVGDHGCEYMTGGRVVVLGRTGVNFAAGMSGGIAYVFDPESLLDARCNLAMVDLELVVQRRDIDELRSMVEKHLKYTGSRKAKHILDNWNDCLPSFVKVFPMEYRRALGQMMKEDEITDRIAPAQW